MTRNNAPLAPRDPSAAESDLDSRYGAIGISAVAAALQFRSKVKNPADAPVSPRPDRQPADVEA